MQAPWKSRPGLVMLVPEGFNTTDQQGQCLGKHVLRGTSILLDPWPVLVQYRGIKELAISCSGMLRFN